MDKEKNTIQVTGRIFFDPTPTTNKHILQSSWKVVAMVMIDCECAKYYNWFLTKAIGVKLAEDIIRGPHITIINDRSEKIQGSSPEERTANWEAIKKKWEGKKITLTLDVDMKSDGKHWWLTVPREDRGEIQAIRDELGLGIPYWSPHLTIARADESNLDNMSYIYEFVRGNYGASTDKFIQHLLNKGVLIYKDGKFTQHERVLKHKRGQIKLIKL